MRNKLKGIPISELPENVAPKFTYWYTGNDVPFSFEPEELLREYKKGNYLNYKLGVISKEQKRVLNLNCCNKINKLLR